MTAPANGIEPGVIHVGDCVEVMQAWPDACVDAVVTDPPYHLTSVTRRFGKPGSAAAACGAYQRHNAGFMGQSWDGGDVAFRPETWAAVLRVLRPGGHLLAFGGTRTYHRMACAVEDAGFEIRDCVAWLYGSGFPKSLNVSKAIDKAAGAARAIVSHGQAVKRMIPGADQSRTGSWVKDSGREYVPAVTVPATVEAQHWDGWGTALKPAFEPIVLARKPLDARNVVENLMTHGVGAINIDASRVPMTTADADAIRAKHAGMDVDAYERPTGVTLNLSISPIPLLPAEPHPLGRWPANVLLDTGAAAALDAQSGPTSTTGNRSQRSRTVTVAGTRWGTANHISTEYAGDSGGASRFFYTAKADTGERSAGLARRNPHPTVKPVDLMAWLVRLVTPPGGVVLDPFLGSGSTAIAAQGVGVRWIGIEQSREYAEIAQQRIGLFAGAAGLSA